MGPCGGSTDNLQYVIKRVSLLARRPTSTVARAQENVKRVQLAEAYLSGAELAGVSGRSMPDEIQREVKKAVGNAVSTK